MKFCSLVLGSWLTTPNLHFLVIGRGDIFDFVGVRPGDAPNVSDSPFMFERLPLSMINRNKIHEIFDKTLRWKVRSENGQYVTEDVSLLEYYNFNADEEVKAIDVIMEQTKGHPRSIFEMLEKCTSKRDLLNYGDESLQ